MTFDEFWLIATPLERASEELKNGQLQSAVDSIHQAIWLLLDRVHQMQPMSAEDQARALKFIHCDCEPT